ncbi:MAG: alpha/beta hydrolase [Acidimicrobiales bacterium]|nr:alpha/beta hydrolase [Acidimicrobiales bacterium]
MPIVEAPDGTRINYETFGRADGPPVLMVQGLGADSRGWLRQRGMISREYRGIVFDNRGVGRSDVPPGPYDLEVMAADAVAVLDDLGLESAHVMGASMGGIIAQILGVRYQSRVRSLTLACTGCRHLPWRRELLAEWEETARTKGMRALVDLAARWLMGPRSRFRLWPVVGVLGPLALNVTPAAFCAQIDAILALDDKLRFELDAIDVPTFVIVGSQDILTPIGDSELLSEMIPGSELVIVTGGAHGFMVENAGRFNDAVRDFLGRVSADDPERRS